MLWNILYTAVDTNLQMSFKQDGTSIDDNEDGGYDECVAPKLLNREARKQENETSAKSKDEEKTILYKCCYD